LFESQHKLSGAPASARTFVVSDVCDAEIKPLHMCSASALHALFSSVSNSDNDKRRGKCE